MGFSEIFYRYFNPEQNTCMSSSIMVDFPFLRQNISLLKKKQPVYCLVNFYYLRQGGYVFARVCLSVC